MPKIGVAGCGRMGLPMAQALQQSGFDVQGFDVRPISEFGEFRGSMANNPSEFAHNLQTVFTVVRDQKQTDELLFDDQNLVGRADELKHIVISCKRCPAPT